MEDTADILIVRDKTYLTEIVELHNLVRNCLPEAQKNYLMPKAAGYFFSAINDQDKFIIAVIQEKKILGFCVLLLASSFKQAIEKKYITAPFESANDNTVSILQSLCVNPNETSRGVSKGLIQKAIELSSENNISNLYAQVAVDNEVCWRIFQNKGFAIETEWTSGHRRFLLSYTLQT